MKKAIITVVILLVVTTGVLFLIPEKKAAPESASSTGAKPDIVETALQKMTLEEKAGQMFFACVYGTDVEEGLTAKYSPGGYVLFADFFEGKDPDTAGQAIAKLQEESKVPLLVGTDEEGGTVTRVSKFPAYRDTPFASPQELYQEGGLDRIGQDAKEKSDLLKSLGLNVNLAPICDVSTNPADYIYSRTLGESPEDTGQFVTTYVTTASESGLGTVLKHFPGYGGNTDTHTGIATDNRTLESFEANDFVPFKAGIHAGADSILVNHNITTAVDSKRPASLSLEVHKLLRKDLAFAGVIMTDDMSMDALDQYKGEENVAVAAINAGNDMLCTGDFQEQIPAVIEAIKNGTISQERLDKSVRRILKWKMKLNLIQ